MPRSLWLLSGLAAVSLLFGLLNIGVGTLHAPPTVRSSVPTGPTSTPFRPPLDSILSGKWNITGDVSWLLQFAIVGFPKCGTSTMMHHLGRHPEVSIFRDERCDPAYNQQAVLIRDAYLYLGRNKTRGIKCPMLLESTQLGMRNMQTFFPKTDLIVGIRHPVLWFESFYNFRVQNEFPMPAATSLQGRCLKGGYNVCTARANFHHVLRTIVPPPWGQAPESTPRVFLYELSQLARHTDHEAEETSLRMALQEFLKLKTPIPPFQWVKPGITQADPERQALLDRKKINICQDMYRDLRRELQQQAVNASLWIRQYFLQAPNVVVSSRKRLAEILEAWERDPCAERNATQLP